MAHRIREAMRDGGLAPIGGAGGIVEADETYFGKVDEKKPSPQRRGRPFIHKGGGPSGKRAEVPFDRVCSHVAARIFLGGMVHGRAGRPAQALQVHASGGVVIEVRGGKGGVGHRVKFLLDPNSWLPFLLLLGLWRSHFLRRLRCRGKCAAKASNRS
jgi:hypothetical protein